MNLYTLISLSMLRLDLSLRYDEGLRASKIWYAAGREQPYADSQAHAPKEPQLDVGWRKTTRDQCCI